MTQSPADLVRQLVEALTKIIGSTHSHVDGRDLLAQLHPRNMLDIKRRVDARETWFEGDWLSNLWTEVKAAQPALAAARAWLQEGQAQPQEPVAIVDTDCLNAIRWSGPYPPYGTPLFTHPAAPQQENAAAALAPVLPKIQSNPMGGATLSGNAARKFLRAMDQQDEAGVLGTPETKENDRG